ncbi:MAG: hypothetical protein FJ144_22700 [Deltaproteobacteria bacterium]|nr:hypothetical protein [Deltaproteobacteria bacterium]
MTRRNHWNRFASLVAVAASLLAIGCGGSGGDGGTTAPPTEPPDNPSCVGESFDSSWEAIQAKIIERHGCTQDVCHGDARSGGLDLRPDAAYASLFEVGALGSAFNRIEPGDNDRSYLWLKLAAATLPGAGIQVAGSAMPSGLPPISEDELEALRAWIYAGAPETGTVTATADLLSACLPEPEPITIEPLDPPAAGEGIQFVLPPTFLAAASEQELCFATYYDFSAQVPEEVIDPTGKYFRFRGQELRQDPQSHHLVLLHAELEPDAVRDPSFGEWTCAGGAREGEGCDPLDLSACGEGGHCRSRVDPRSIGCIGFGPQGAGLAIFQQIGGAQAAQAQIEFREGVFGQMPIRGIAYWSSHAFNLTSKDTMLNGRLNFYFARDQRFPLQAIFDVDDVFSPNAAPYTEGTTCGEYVLPRGARLFGITSHTHARGKHFWAETPDGTRIYENFIYNDPLKQFFEPPFAFDSTNPADRTIHYCATYNNGMNEDGSPNPETVTRASRVPPSALQTFGACRPIACAAGNVGAACNGENDDASCDSSPGAGDGLCDACRITGGESTENEMFILIGQYFIDPSFPQPPVNGPVFAGLASLPPGSGSSAPLE